MKKQNYIISLSGYGRFIDYNSLYIPKKFRDKYEWKITKHHVKLVKKKNND
jgi:hypothetical protein